MADAFAKIDISGVEELQSRMERYGEGTGQVVQEYLQDDGFRRIGIHIQDLIHASGRHWAKKAASATTAAYTSVFDKSISGMSMVVKSKPKYGYLYFPDDGSNTKHHAGGQQFMQRGADDATDEIVQEIVQRLAAAFEEA